MVQLTSRVIDRCTTLDAKVGMALNTLEARKRNPNLETIKDYNYL